MAEDALKVCKAVKNEEDLLHTHFGKEFIVRYPPSTEYYVSNALKGLAEHDAKLTKSAYEVWCVLALINLTKPRKIIDPVGMEENRGFWLKSRYRKYGVHWTRPDGTSVRDQVPTNVIWETEDSKVYSIAYQPHIGLTALTLEQRAWFKTETQGEVWNLSGYLSESGVGLVPDILLYEKRVENVVDFRSREIPEIDFVINVETKCGWSEDRALIKKLEDYAVAFRPRKGAYIISLHEETPKLVSKIRVIAADLDKNKLKKLLFG